jgi:phage terminase small subunit
MTRDEIIATLQRDNPKARIDELVMYADAYLGYTEATNNITEHGNIVAHPRTGQPIENPYCKVLSSAMSRLKKLTRVRHVEALWR